MRKNSKSKPNNSCVVNVQLDRYRSTAFHQMMNVTGLTQSELLREIINPVIDDYIYNCEKKCADIQKQTAFEALKRKQPKTCETCHWRSDDFVCINGGSERRGDFVNRDDTCDRWTRGSEEDKHADS